MERDYFNDICQEAWPEGGQINETGAGGDDRVKGWLPEIRETFLHICCMLMVSTQERSGLLMTWERGKWGKMAEAL